MCHSLVQVLEVLQIWARVPAVHGRARSWWEKMHMQEIYTSPTKRNVLLTQLQGSEEPLWCDEDASLILCCCC